MPSLAFLEGFRERQRKLDIPPPDIRLFKRDGRRKVVGWELELIEDLAGKGLSAAKIAEALPWKRTRGGVKIICRYYLIPLKGKSGRPKQ